ncbi:MAG: glycoside hydrolase family 5 protein [Lachnospiraceae bacterium]|nr:glycoside hydrolase family 5 protein [Lachnospiraceae bacterium]
MKRGLLTGILIALFSVMGALLPQAAAEAATPVEKWGQLSVSGANIVNEAGKKVQLKGVSTHGIAWFPQYVNSSCFQSFRKMGVNTIRLAFYSDPSAGYSESLYSKVEEGVKAATDLGMYVIIDWHILSDGNPKTHQKQALKFFTHFAKKYGSQKNILYEICNEPNGNVTWQGDIRPYANKVIKRIRQYDENNIIIVGTPTWSQDVDIAAQKPLKQKNIVYTLHFYAATHTDYIRQKLVTARKMGLPVLVSEFNICDASGNGQISKSSGTKWMKLLKKYKIGHVAWNVSNKAETSALIKSSCQKTGGFTKKNLSKTGRFIAKWWKK